MDIALDEQTKLRFSMDAMTIVYRPREFRLRDRPSSMEDAAAAYWDIMKMVDVEVKLCFYQAQFLYYLCNFAIYEADTFGDLNDTYDWLLHQHHYLHGLYLRCLEALALRVEADLDMVSFGQLSQQPPETTMKALDWEAVQLWDRLKMQFSEVKGLMKDIQPLRPRRIPPEHLQAGHDKCPHYLRHRVTMAVDFRFRDILLRYLEGIVVYSFLLKDLDIDLGPTRDPFGGGSTQDFLRWWITFMAKHMARSEDAQKDMLEASEYIYALFANLTGEPLRLVANVKRSNRGFWQAMTILVRKYGPPGAEEEYLNIIKDSIRLEHTRETPAPLIPHTLRKLTGPLRQGTSTVVGTVEEDLSARAASEKFPGFPEEMVNKSLKRIRAGREKPSSGGAKVAKRGRPRKRPPSPAAVATEAVGNQYRQHPDPQQKEPAASSVKHKDKEAGRTTLRRSGRTRRRPKRWLGEAEDSEPKAPSPRATPTMDASDEARTASQGSVGDGAELRKPLEGPRRRKRGLNSVGGRKPKRIAPNGSSRRVVHSPGEGSSNREQPEETEDSRGTLRKSGSSEDPRKRRLPGPAWEKHQQVTPQNRNEESDWDAFTIQEQSNSDDRTDPQHQMDATAGPGSLDDATVSMEEYWEMMVDTVVVTEDIDARRSHRPTEDPQEGSSRSNQTASEAVSIPQTNQEPEGVVTCRGCKSDKEHLPRTCPHFWRLTRDERELWLEESGRCRRCFYMGHNEDDCDADIMCLVKGCPFPTEHQHFLHKWGSMD